MKAEWYFECAPWDKVCAEIRATEGVEAIECVSVQCVDTAQAQQRAQAWEQRLQQLLGSPVQRSVLTADKAVSVLVRYPGNVIARIFADAQSTEAYDNFEVTTRKALYVWKPSSHPQARFESAQGSESVCRQVFSSDLEVQ